MQEFIMAAALIVAILIFKNQSGSVVEGLAKTIAKELEEYLNGLYQHYGQAYKLDWLLLKAIAIVESNENPDALNPRDPSTGLMQILCVPGPGGKCKNKLNVMGWDLATVERLKDPDFNLSIASQILKWNIDNYGFKRGIAVYNRWGSRNDPPNGPFGNQAYVDKVLREYEILKQQYEYGDEVIPT